MIGCSAGRDGQSLVDRPGLLVGVGVGEVVAGVVHGDDRLRTHAARAGELPVGSMAGFQPTMVPSSVAKRNSGRGGCRRSRLAGPVTLKAPAPIAGVEHRPRRRAAGRGVTGVGMLTDQRVYGHLRAAGARDLVERGQAGVVVRDPERAAAALGDAPRVDQVGVGTAATPGRSETRLVCRTLPAVAGLARAAAVPAPTGTSDPTATNDNTANSGRASVRGPTAVVSSCTSMPCSRIPVPDNQVRRPSPVDRRHQSRHGRLDTVTSDPHIRVGSRNGSLDRNLFGAGGRRRRTALAARGGRLAIDQCHHHAAGSLVIECLVEVRDSQGGTRG